MVPKAQTGSEGMRGMRLHIGSQHDDFQFALVTELAGLHVGARQEVKGVASRFA